MFEVSRFHIKPLPGSPAHPLNGTEMLKPLLFTSPEAELSSDSVNYHFDVLVDDEISADVFCKYKGVDKTKGVFLQNVFADCPDTQSVGGDVNQYSTNITAEDIGEIC